LSYRGVKRPVNYNGLSAAVKQAPLA